jgi:hypothetical protein
MPFLDTTRLHVLLAGALAAGALAACEGSSPADATGTDLFVRAASGGTVPLRGTRWSSCAPNDPSPGSSWRQFYRFDAAVVTVGHDVYPSLDCTGTADAAQHFEATSDVAVGPERTVGWTPAPPAGLGASVVATGVVFSNTGLTRKLILFVDDTVSPRALYHQGDPGAPRDAAGYPTELDAEHFFLEE